MNWLYSTLNIDRSLAVTTLEKITLCVDLCSLASCNGAKLISREPKGLQDKLKGIMRVHTSLEGKAGAPEPSSWFKYVLILCYTRIVIRDH